MIYCDKFYSLAGLIKNVLDVREREVLLSGTVDSPFGQVPKFLYYSGDAIESVHDMMFEVNRMLYSCWYPDDGMGCMVVCCGNNMRGDIAWEKTILEKNVTGVLL